MQDFISRLAFGFVMAQFVPGLLSVVSVSFLYISLGEVKPSISEQLSSTISCWTASGPLQVAFALLSVAAGMLIHGIHWAVLGFLEHQYRQPKNDGFEPGPVAKSFWHDRRICVQILAGPLKVTIEILWLLICGRNPRDIAIAENIPRIKGDKIEGLKMLHDFYLHFAQFYAHTSYALVAILVSLATYFAATRLSWLRIGILVLVYLLSGLFFVIGRIQLGGLFKAENELAAA